MKILIVDRDEITTQLMKTRLEPLGHKITEEPVKNTAIERMSADPFDIVFIDAAPLTSARPIILNLRRATRHYTYILQMGQEITRAEAIQSSANDCLMKPVDPEALDTAIENAKGLTSLIRRIGDESEDFPSASGIIAKSAFNQLFLSAIERADRYGERSFVVFISLANYKQIAEREGIYAADYTSAKLSQYLVRLRRQSDIIAQTEKYEFALLLQRPIYETEPADATNRFAEAVASYDELFRTTGEVPPEVHVSLVDLPIGSRLIHHVVSDATRKK
jgi:CheY-like chemotaxis protein